MSDLLLLLYAFFSDTLLGKIILISYAVGTVVTVVVVVFQLIVLLKEYIQTIRRSR